jgi:hypothetical protein
MGGCGPTTGLMAIGSGRRELRAAGGTGHKRTIATRHEELTSHGQLDSVLPSGPATAHRPR